MRIGMIDSPSGDPFYRDACENAGAVLVEGVTANDIRQCPDYDLCITAGEYCPEQALPVIEAGRQGIPTLLVMDGILEWRNTWEHPQLTAPLLQPVLSDKVACIGASQARILESWGNIGKCEIIGMPRLDPFLQGSLSANPGNCFTILVASAKTPFFTRDQQQLVMQGMKQVCAALRTDIRAPQGQKIEVLWRISQELYDGLDGVPADRNCVGENLHELLPRVDAVISTPSTLLLEAMLYRIPVAILDFTNSPQYVQAAWSITSSEHIEPVLKDLLRAPRERMMLQDNLLHDALYCRTPAGPRLTALIKSMIEAGGRRNAQASKTLLSPASEKLQRHMSVDLPVATDSDAVDRQCVTGKMEDPGRIYCELQYINELLERRGREIDNFYRFGVGGPLSRLVYTFPHPRRMLASLKRWWKSRRPENNA